VRFCPLDPNSALSTYDPANAPICEPIAAPVMVAPSSVKPAGMTALPMADPTAASASVAMILNS